MTNEKIILGIDPGTNIMGFGLIIIRGKELEFMEMGIERLNKIPDHALKLKQIFLTVLALIDKNKPDELAIEAPFFGKNVQSMLKLGRAQGVAIAAALYRDIPIFEYSPRKIKQSITGSGSASKEQVAAMLFNLLKIEDKTIQLDATDGLAAAVCHYFQRIPAGASTKYTGWEAFLSQNPERIKKI